MLPNFLIIGVQKGATTWLAYSLGEHPDIFMAEQKEVHYFNRHFEKGLGWYESQFRDWAGQVAIGEATPGYIYFPDMPSKIQATLGNRIKFIVSLRHPVDRAYSAFWMFQSRGIIPPDADFRTLFYRGDHGLQKRGYYFVQLSHYLNYFPRENFLILIYEEIKQNNQMALERCLEFLGVNVSYGLNTIGNNSKNNKAIAVSVFHEQIWGLRRAMKKSLPPRLEKPLASFGRRIFNQLPKRKGYEPLDVGLRQELFRYFLPDIKQLEKLLDRDLSIWCNPSHT